MGRSKKLKGKAKVTRHKNLKGKKKLKGQATGTTF